MQGLKIFVLSPVKSCKVDVVLAQRHEGEEQCLPVDGVKAVVVEHPRLLRRGQRTLAPGTGGRVLAPHPLPDDGLHAVLEVVLLHPLDDGLHQRVHHAGVSLGNIILI